MSVQLIKRVSLERKKLPQYEDFFGLKSYKIDFSMLQKRRQDS